jgi:phosphatidylglycerol:prolipoprotein diacylglycerol transferase
VHPVAIDLGWLKIHWYGILIAIGFLLGIWTACRRGLRQGLDPHQLSDLAMWLLVGALLGARTLHVISYWDSEFKGRPLVEIFKIQNGGLVFYGGLIGAVLAGSVFIRLKKLPFYKTADALAPSIALGSVFGRFGCLMTGCCFGRVCSLPWGIRFPDQSLAWEQQERLHLIGQHDPALPVHPTQLYDAFANLLLYVALAWLYRRKRFDGQVFAVFLVGYAVLRSTVELFRGDYLAPQMIAGLTPGQLVSVGTALAGIALLLFLPRPAPRS